MEGINLEELFPTDGVVPEHRQIGRAGPIMRLTGRMVGGRNTLLLERRRVGKTSVALAALQHCRSEHGAVTVHVDLVDGARAPRQVVAAIVRQAREQDVGKATARLKRRLRRIGAGSPLAEEGVRAASKVLEVEEIEGLVTTVGETLAASGEADLGEVLLALEADAYVSRRPVVAFFDEVQALGVWGEQGEELQRQLATTLGRANGRVTFLFAGSRLHAVEQLFAEGKPLCYAGLNFDLDQISHEDWFVGLVERFKEAGYALARPRVDAILSASDGHPLRTMQVCAHVYEWARNGVGQEVSDAAVARGIATAREHPSWKDADE